MSHEVTYTIAVNVSRSWERMKAMKGFESQCGELIFAKLFELAPEIKFIFGFPMDEDFRAHPKFPATSKSMIDIIDYVVEMLGPDLEPLAEQLRVLGRRHVAYGVRPEYLPMMSQAVIYALMELLGDNLSSDDYKGWVAVFNMTVAKMTVGMQS